MDEKARYSHEVAFYHGMGIRASSRVTDNCCSCCKNALVSCSLLPTPRAIVQAPAIGSYAWVLWSLRFFVPLLSLCRPGLLISL